ncbi:hypothetical protein PFICI_11560 [Pestalotiopsis fici W106-1]|uniref:Uncharacterized protein n=1 Tax=Pestalotiopsis fici (strain W106-1 / CGMCC3.15140) TaxID=1229662 RepID=W3WQQ4_PESFW|nr:uncharacterized protein PFICI_11560 [Pestalotiopsis fici W106-1]ETS76173.1 hypothetical protein PFICI_11560 [Pestalotiopsis fici W106-1]
MVEAILGAIHLEGGDAALERAMKKLGLLEHPYLPEDGQAAAPQYEVASIFQRAKHEVKVLLGTDEPEVLDNYVQERKHKSHEKEAAQNAPFRGDSGPSDRLS